MDDYATSKDYVLETPGPHFNWQRENDGPRLSPN
jgi:hypothetical protein